MKCDRHFPGPVDWLTCQPGRFNFPKWVWQWSDNGHLGERERPERLQSLIIYVGPGYEQFLNGHHEHYQPNLFNCWLHERKYSQNLCPSLCTLSLYLQCPVFVTSIIDDMKRDWPSEFLQIARNGKLPPNVLKCSILVLLWILKVLRQELVLPSQVNWP